MTSKDSHGQKADADKGTHDWTDKQQARVATKGVKQESFRVPHKQFSKQAVGGYYGKKPFGK